MAPLAGSKALKLVLFLHYAVKSLLHIKPVKMLEATSNGTLSMKRDQTFQVLKRDGNVLYKTIITPKKNLNSPSWNYTVLNISLGVNFNGCINFVIAKS